jgi:leader peptidase (prepilin peptidase)/N-methyltransferase
MILAIPLSLRLLGLFCAGVILAGFVNLGVYRLAWNQRSLSPWSAPPGGGVRRRWPDLLPLFGWWALRRESPLHGRGFWIRPLLVELATGLLFAGLYLCETEWAGMLGFVANGIPPRADFLSDNLPLVLHARYASHVILVALMLVASLIDIDEKTIPDAITIPGTLVGLALAALCPWSLLEAGEWFVNGSLHVEFLTIASPQAWPDALDGLPLAKGLAIALGCWTLWCVGLLPRRWNTRHGWTTALRVFLHRLRVEPATYSTLLMGLVGVATIGLVAALAPAVHWAALLTSLVGMAGGGAMVWTVRVIGTAALRREAMGFGDVTLLAMIGAFVGWQAALLIFFLAPFAGLVVGLAQWIFHGEHEIPYGPFLCLAAVGMIVDWPAVWQWGFGIFQMGGLVPALLAGCMGLMGGMLWIYRIVRDLLSRPAK